MKYLKNTLLIGTILSLRMIGLFMVIPLLSPYLQTMPHATPTLIGLAIGIYGFTQALMQFPMGFSSDMVGRKPVIAFGLVIFALGSLIAGAAHNIETVIIGRALQGAGAIGSTCLALLADVTPIRNRTSAMAIVGITVGIAFSLAMVIGPVLHIWLSIPQLFFTTIVFAGIAIGLLGLINSSSIFITPHPPIVLNQIAWATLFKPSLSILYVSIFLLHTLFTAAFVATPMLLIHFNVDKIQQGYFYLATLLGAIVFLIPLLMIEKRKSSLLFYFAILILAIAQIGLASLHEHIFGVAIGLLLFLTGFNFLEAFLPSMASKLAQADYRGTTLGIFTTCQYFGVFVGGITGGWLLGQVSLHTIYILGAILTCFWLLFAVKIFNLNHVRSA